MHTLNWHCLKRGPETPGTGNQDPGATGPGTQDPKT